MPRSYPLLLTILSLIAIVPSPARSQSAQNEEILFFDGRGDQTATENGGAVFFPLESKLWRFWFQDVFHATISPDAKKVAYRFQNSINVADIDGLNQKTLAFDLPGSPLSWSPSGDRIAFFRGLDLTVLDLEGNTVFSEQVAPGNIHSFRPPSWSSDGSKIFFTSEIGYGVTEDVLTVGTVDLATGEKTDIYNPVRIDDETEYFAESLLYPALSPKGDKIAVIRSTFKRPKNGSFQERTTSLAVMPATGGPPVELTSFPIHEGSSVLPRWIVAFDWSPDGTELAYAIDPFGDSQSPIEQGIYQISASGGIPKKISEFVPRHFGYTSGQNASTSFQWTILNPVAELVVNSTGDRPRAEDAEGCETGELLENGDPECTLRSAIQAVNAGVGNSIRFEIEGEGVHQIVPETPLPTLTQEVTIDGSTDSESDFIWIRGNGEGGALHGLSSNGAEVTFRGLIITEFVGSGIHIDGGSGHTIEQCILGTDTVGNGNLGNGTGLTVLNADDVTIGNNAEAPAPSSDDSDLPEKQAEVRSINIGIGNLLNVISGNGNGVLIEKTNNVSMHWNLLGTKPNGLEQLENLQTALKTLDIDGFTLGNTTRPTTVVGGLLGAEFENSINSAINKVYINLDINGENPFTTKPNGFRIRKSKKMTVTEMLAANLTENALEFEDGEEITMNDFKLGTNLSGKLSAPVGTGIRMNRMRAIQLSNKIEKQLNMINANTGMFLKDIKAMASDANPEQQSDSGVSPRANIGGNLISGILFNLDIDGEESLSTMENGICLFDSCELDLDDVTMGPITDKAVQLENVQKFNMLSALIGTNKLGTKHFPVRYGIHAQNSQGIGIGSKLRRSLIAADIGMFLKNLNTFNDTEVIPSSTTRSGFTTRGVDIGNKINNLLINLDLEGENSLNDTTETGICLQNSSDFDMDDIFMGPMREGFLVSDSRAMRMARIILGTNPSGTKVFPMTYGFHGTNLKGFSFGDANRKSLIMAKTGLFLKNLKAIANQSGGDPLSQQNGTNTRFELNIQGNQIQNMLFNLSEDGEESMADEVENGICLQDSCDLDIDNILTGRMTNGIFMNNSALIRMKRMRLGSNYSGTKIYRLLHGVHATNSQGLNIGSEEAESIINAVKAGLFMKNVKAYQGDGNTVPQSVRAGVSTRANITGNFANNLLFNLDLTGEESMAEDAEIGICMENTSDFEMNNIFMGRMLTGILALQSELIKVRSMLIGVSKITNKFFMVETGIDATDCQGLNFGDPESASAIAAKLGAFMKNVKAYKETETVPNNTLREGYTTRGLNLGNSFSNIAFNLGLQGKTPLGNPVTAFCLDDSCEWKVNKAMIGPTSGNAVEVLNSSLIEISESFIGESIDGAEDFAVGGFGVLMNDLSKGVKLIDNTIANSEMGAVKVEGESAMGDARDIVIRKNRMFDNIQSIIRDFSTSGQQVVDAFNGSTVVKGSVQGQPGDTVIMDFYTQGPSQTISAAELYLGEQAVQLDASGFGEYTAVFKDVTPAEWKVATTVTDSISGTSPLSPPVSLTAAPDTDMDGMPDYWENLFHCLDPNDPEDADEDCDVDGATNLEEYENRRVPTLDERQIGVGRFDIGDVNSLTFGALDNFEYILECSLNLQPGNWVEVDRIVVEDGGEVTLSDPSPPAASKFYRITGRSLP